jgi:integrase
MALGALKQRVAPQEQTIALTVKEVLNRYLSSLEATIKDTTIGEYAYQLERYFCKQFGAREISTITPVEIRTVLKDMLQKGLSVATVNTVRTRVSGLFNFAVREQLTDTNPAQLVKPFRHEAGKPSLVQKPWDLHEIRRALLASEGDQLHLFVVLCLFTGLRRGEVAGLSWGDFNEKERTLDINESLVSARVWDKRQVRSGIYRQTPKTSSSIRMVYCSDESIKAICKARRRFTELTGRLPGPEDPMIFGSRGQSFDPSSLTQKFKRFCKAKGLRQIRVHDLRHTSAVIALEAGIPLEAVSEGLGHSGVDITKRIYAPRVPGLGQRFSAQLNAFLVEDTLHAASKMMEESSNV